MNILQYAIRRLFALIPVVLLVAIFTFFIMHLIPGSPAIMMLGPQATVEDIRQLEEEMGLNQPLYVQFQKWFFGILQGDFGESVFLDEPVSKLILHAAEPSFFLAIFSLSISIVIGIPAGIIAAVKKGTLWDQIALTSALLGASIPSFWLGLNLILLLGVIANLLPTSGYESILTGNFYNIGFLIMPAIALGFPNSAQITRLTRSTMLDVLGEDYIKTARSKGLRELTVILKHALRNALTVIITVISFSFLNLMSRAVVSENVFRIPGLGRLIVNSISRRDYPVVQGILICVAGAYIIINLLTDLVYVIINPQIRY